MAYGWYENGVCYSNQQEAIDKHFHTIPPFVSFGSNSDSIITYEKQSGGNWHIVKNNYSSGSVIKKYSVSTPNPVQASCPLPDDPATRFQDGIELGWAVSGVIIIVYVIARLRR